MDEITHQILRYQSDEMNTELSVSIMAVPERRKLVAKLQSSLAYPSIIHWDVNRTGCWPNSRKAWSALSPTTTHKLVLADDISICANFITHVQNTLKVLPDQIITYWTGRSGKKPSLFNRALKSNSHWLRLNTDLRMTACLMPTLRIKQFLSFCDRYIREDDQKYDDMRIDAFLLLNEILYYQTIPELAEHEGSAISTTSVRSNRIAYSYDPNPPIDIDWTQGIDIPPGIIPPASWLQWFEENKK